MNDKFHDDLYYRIQLEHNPFSEILLDEWDHKTVSMSSAVIAANHKYGKKGWKIFNCDECWENYENSSKYILCQK